MLWSSALSTLYSASFVASASTPWSLAGITGWLSSVDGNGMSEPLWLAVWGASLIATSMVSQSIGHRLDARRRA